MTELTKITEAIVDICNDATAHGEELDGGEIIARVRRRLPDAPSALVELAFPQAAARLRAEAARAFVKADALEAELRRREANAPSR